MNLKQMLAGVTAFGVAVATQSAVAGTINVSYAGSANFGGSSVGYESGLVLPNPNSNISFAAVYIGGDSFTSSNHNYDFSASGQFNTWCVDITHWMSTGSVTYDVGSAGNLAAALGLQGDRRVRQLVRLADEVYSTVDTKLESAAFQLAVWAITFGVSDGAGRYHVNTTNTGFRVDDGTANSLYGVQANRWLDQLGAADITGNYTLTYLNDGTREITQDMIVFTDPPTIPEPASLALLGFGLVGLGISRRNKAPKL